MLLKIQSSKLLTFIIVASKTPNFLLLTSNISLPTSHLFNLYTLYNIALTNLVNDIYIFHHFSKASMVAV